MKHHESSHQQNQTYRPSIDYLMHQLIYHVWCNIILEPTYIHIPDVTSIRMHELLLQARRNNLYAAIYPESEQNIII